MIQIPCWLTLGYLLSLHMFQYFAAGLIILFFQQTAFAFTVLMNPGLPSRNLDTHAKSYINRVTTIDPQLYCSACNVIHTKDVPTEHCTFCDYCIEGLDHHCPWSSKCIANRNLLAFKLFLGSTLVLLISLFTGVAVVMSEISPNR